MVPQMMPQMRPMPVMHPMAMQRPPFGKFRSDRVFGLHCVLTNVSLLIHLRECVIISTASWYIQFVLILAMPLTLNLEINIDDNEESEFGGRYRKFSQTIARSNCKIIRINELSNSAKSCATLIGL